MKWNFYCPFCHSYKKMGIQINKDVVRCPVCDKDMQILERKPNEKARTKQWYNQGQYE